MIHLPGNDKQQVVTDGNPYLCKDRIPCRSEERLDTQMLLDPLEEQLYLPTLTIQLRNRKRINEEIVRKESVHVVRRKVLIDNHPHHLRIVLGNEGSRKPDALVADESCMHVNLPAPDNLKAHIVLCPCDKVSLSELEVVVKSPKVQHLPQQEGHQARSYR